MGEGSQSLPLPTRGNYGLGFKEGGRESSGAVAVPMTSLVILFEGCIKGDHVPSTNWMIGQRLKGHEIEDQAG